MAVTNNPYINRWNTPLSKGNLYDHETAQKRPTTFIPERPVSTVPEGYGGGGWNTTGIPPLPYGQSRQANPGRYETPVVETPVEAPQTFDNFKAVTDALHDNFVTHLNPLQIVAVAGMGVGSPELFSAMVRRMIEVTRELRNGMSFMYGVALVSAVQNGDIPRTMTLLSQIATAWYNQQDDSQVNELLLDYIEEVHRGKRNGS